MHDIQGDVLPNIRRFRAMTLSPLHLVVNWSVFTIRFILMFSYISLRYKTALIIDEHLVFTHMLAMVLHVMWALAQYARPRRHHALSCCGRWLRCGLMTSCCRYRTAINDICRLNCTSCWIHCHDNLCHLTRRVQQCRRMLTDNYTEQHNS